MEGVVDEGVVVEGDGVGGAEASGEEVGGMDAFCVYVEVKILFLELSSAETRAAMSLARKLTHRRLT